MEVWFLKHIGKFLSGFIVIVTFAIMLIGYIYNGDKASAKEDRDKLYKALKVEILERKFGDSELAKEDAKLDLKIDTKLGQQAFNEFKATIDYIVADQRAMSRDIKTILINTKD